MSDRLEDPCARCGHPRYTHTPQDVGCFRFMVEWPVEDTIPSPTTENGELDEAVVERAARAICDVWGYLWEGDPTDDWQVAPEKGKPYDERPDKALYRKAARAVLAAIALPDPPPGTIPLSTWHEARTNCN